VIVYFLALECTFSQGQVYKSKNRSRTNGRGWDWDWSQIVEDKAESEDKIVASSRSLSEDLTSLVTILKSIGNGDHTLMQMILSIVL